MKLDFNSKDGGIIPAYAGNTFIIHAHRGSYRDHPRVCGEHILENITAINPEGSSPRMRGTLGINNAYAQAQGIIPAYAGNTRTVSFRFRKIWDHPRVCGEHFDYPSARPCAQDHPRVCGEHLLSIPK